MDYASGGTLRALLGRTSILFRIDGGALIHPSLYAKLPHLSEHIRRSNCNCRAGQHFRESAIRLTAENDKLWKVAMKDAPREEPPTVVVQQAPPQKPSPLERYMLLRSLLPPAQPYQLPTPVNPNANRLRTNCVTTTLATSTTNCN